MDSIALSRSCVTLATAGSLFATWGARATPHPVGSLASVVSSQTIDYRLPRTQYAARCFVSSDRRTACAAAATPRAPSCLRALPGNIFQCRPVGGRDLAFKTTRSTCLYRALPKTDQSTVDRHRYAAQRP